MPIGRPIENKRHLISGIRKLSRNLTSILINRSFRLIPLLLRKTICLLILAFLYRILIIGLWS